MSQASYHKGTLSFVVATATVQQRDVAMSTGILAKVSCTVSIDFFASKLSHDIVVNLALSCNCHVTATSPRQKFEGNTGA